MILLITFLFGMTIFLGTIIILITKDNEKISQISISIAFSVLFLLIFLEVIPHALEHLDYFKMIFYGVIGFISLKLLDLFIPNHEHSNNKNHIFHIGIMASVALVIHNIIEGMVLYTTLKNNFELGILLGFGIGIHNIPMGMVIASSLELSGYKRTKILSISFMISLATFIGGIVIQFINNVSEYFIGVMFSLTLRMLVYIVFFELLHHLKHQNKKNNIIGFVMGVIIICLSLIFHNH